MTLAEYARRRGVSATAVYAARDSGWIQVGSDGRLDPVQADKSWPEQRRGRRGGRREGAGRKPADEAVPPTGGPPPGGTLVVDLAEAIRRKEVANAERAELEVLKLKNEMLEMARRVVAEAAALDRAHWEQFPDRYFAQVAAAVGAAEPDKLRRVLEDAIREHLALLANVKIAGDTTEVAEEAS